MIQTPTEPESRRLLVVGATGTIGSALVRALLGDGHQVVVVVRDRAAATGLPAESDTRVASVTDAAALTRDGFRGERFDAVFSCIASRSGVPADAWAIDHVANLNVLHAAKACGVPRMILLSAICVAEPELAFQHAKLAFEQALRESGLTWSIVRPTAYFKSLSGQLDRLRRGKPFLVFGDGALTRCNPISDDDLARYLAGCLDEPDRCNAILPIGGPGLALTPRQQGALLFAALGLMPRYRKVPVAMLDAIIAVLTILGRVSPRLAAKAELARIGRYYATHSMLAEHATGTETLADFYRALVAGTVRIERRDHAVF